MALQDELLALVTSLVESKKSAVKGAYLKQYLMTSRASQELKTAISATRFREFIQGFDDYLVATDKSSFDFLIVPKTYSSFLTQSGLNIRSDFYKAFTQFSETNKPYYDKETDSIIWAASSTAGSPLIPIPNATIDLEIDRRKRFVSDMLSDNTPLSDELLEKLSNRTTGLTDFSSALSKHLLHNKWMAYKKASVMKSIESWAKANDLPINSSWYIQSDSQVPSNQLGLQESHRFSRFIEKLSSLSEDDLKRISVPLDIVKKII